ncbi:MAG: TRAP transporter small permease subunit [Rhizobiaceae bacterium]|nr:TRAP transporter small permease subunit [Rhizobiaceae bacterium]
MAHDTDTPSSHPVGGASPVHTILRGIVWIGQATAWLLMPILALVLIGVILSAAKVGIIARWESDILLFGSKLTLASIGDLQWHLFGVMLMCAMAGAIVSDAHVRVDFIRQNMSERQKDVIDVLGHVFFLLPMCAIIVYNGYDFTIRSFNMNEGSDYDGLYDRFILKVFIPFGFGLMFLAGAGLTVRTLLKLFNSKAGQTND